MRPILVTLSLLNWRLEEARKNRLTSIFYDGRLYPPDLIQAVRDRLDEADERDVINATDKVLIRFVRSDTV